MYNIKDKYRVVFTMIRPLKELSIPKTFDINPESTSDFDKTSLIHFNTYSNLYTNGVSQSASVYCWLLTIWSSLTILSYIPLPIMSNCALLCITMYYTVYNNIHKSIGNKMAVYLLFNYMFSNIISLIYPNHFFLACILFTLSMACNIGSYAKFEYGSITKLPTLDESAIYVIPLYTFTYIEDSYNIQKHFSIMMSFICNYIKKFSTSDVIKDELKDRGVDSDGVDKKLLDETENIIEEIVDAKKVTEVEEVTGIEDISANTSSTNSEKKTK